LIAGVSVGAFAANSCINELEKARRILSKQDAHSQEQTQAQAQAQTQTQTQTRAQTRTQESSALLGLPILRLTLLDPFCARGVFGVAYGAREFGKRADYCEVSIFFPERIYRTDNLLYPFYMKSRSCVK